MIGTFLRLTAWELRNRISTRLRRLRQPRYLLGLAAGVTYIYWFVLRNQLRATRRGDFTVDSQFATIIPIVLVVGGLAIWFVSLVAWFWPSTEPPVRFTRAEVQFFFPAPVTRRQVLNYKLLRSQSGIIFGLLVVAVFSGAAISGRLWFVPGGWLLFSTIRLHMIGVAFTRASLAGWAGRPPTSTWAPIGLTGLIAATVLGTFLFNLPALLWLPFGEMFRRVVALGTSGPAGAALWPFKALVEPVLATSARDFAATAAPAAALMALNYWWVLRSDATLEESAVAAERQQATGRRRAPEPTARRAPFELRPGGRAEVAILWKNLIQLTRYASPRVLLRLLLPIVALSVAAGSLGMAGGFTPVALFAAGAAASLGPAILRNDLRLDMTRLSVLKTWPVRGATLVLGELLAPAAIIAIVIWASLAVAFALSGGAGIEGLSVLDRASLALAAALVAPAVALAQLVIQNGAVVLFPGWIHTGPTRPRGVEAMGQQMLMLAGTVVVLAVGVLPAAALAGAVGFVLFLAGGYGGLVPAAALFAAVLGGEVFLAVELLGRVLDVTDPAQVEAAEG